MSAKKLLNDPTEAVPELLEGLVRATGGRIRLLEPTGAVVAADLVPNRVGVLFGGGSGHEPLFAGFIGEGLADAAACGHVFAAPSPDVILAATRAAGRDRGVVYVYGNYAGDVLNFDLAAELAADEGIATRTVRVWDDVASAPRDRVEDRRGIAGDLFVIKIAGAAAATGVDLEEVVRLASKARDATRSMGVALAAGSIPETGAPTFEIGADELEIGMGLHGERGVRRQSMAPADEVVDLMLETILDDLPFRSGDRVCLLVNDLGSTTLMELLIAVRRAAAGLDARHISIHDIVVGAFCTSQEMAGLSLSLLRLDDELVPLYERPARSLGWTRA